MSRTVLLCALIVVSLILALPVLSSAHARSSQTMSPSARLDTPPHIGYGINVWNNIDLAQPLGFDWVKIYEDNPSILATIPLTTHVLLRVTADGYPASLAGYVQHVSDLVSANQDVVDAVEIGNEPNVRWSWGDQSVSPEQYARLLCNVAPAVKAVAPGVIVVSAGVAPVGRTPSDQWGRAMDDRVYVQRMLDTMRSEFPARYPCFDAFGYHAEGFPYPPETAAADLPPDDNGNQFHFRAVEYYRTLMVDNDIGDRPIWLTEFGWLRDPAADPWYGDPALGSTYGWCNNTTGTEFDGFKWMRVTEAQQADYVARAFAYADANWPWMGPMFLWNLDWNNRGWDCDHVKFFSIFHASAAGDGQPGAHDPAQAYAALAAMPKRYVAPAAPALSVQPAELNFLALLSHLAVQTQTLYISNTTASTTLTWTVSVDGAAQVQPVVSPISGANGGAVTVQIDTSAFGATGTVTGAVIVTANPTTTTGSPFTVPVTLRVVEHGDLIYLPIIGRDAPTPPPNPVSTTTRFGAVFITAAEAPANEERFQRALATGAGVDRWPLYWQAVETREGHFVWNDPLHNVDLAVSADIAHGLQPLAILMNTPSFYATAGSQSAPAPRIGPQYRLKDSLLAPQDLASISSAGSPPARLTEPVFSDGTDTPGAGKTINSSNPWARFVHEAVSRYKPGGALAQQQGWAADQGVRHWEIWNEQDYSGFWIGTPADYARLLKVAYLAARHADPQARIIFGGLANFEKPTWLEDTLAVINTYPDRDAGNWFFDSVAEHNYAWSWHTWYYLYRASQALKAHSITGKSLWVTESGVALCDEYPGPACIIGGSPVSYRANPEEQAAFVIQSATYATWINSEIPVEAILHFQFYDDCGDRINDDLGGGFGLMRNPADAACFRKSPSPNTPRPSYAAFQTAARYLSDVTIKWRARPTPHQEIFSFYRPATQDRVVAMWARGYTAQTAVITATSTSAQLVGPDGSSQTLVPSDGAYRVTLPAATNINTPTSDGSAPIGGRPFFLVEPDPSGTGGPRP